MSYMSNMSCMSCMSPMWRDGGVAGIRFMALLLVVALRVDAAEVNWPEFRGPRGDGRAGHRAAGGALAQALTPRAGRGMEAR